MKKDHSPSDMGAEDRGSYIPGYVGAKLVMTFAGLVVFGLGVAQLWTPIELVLRGTHVMGEAIYVSKEKAGLTPAILRTDAEIAASQEPSDRSYIFWNVYEIHHDGNLPLQIRSNVGSRVSPLHGLFDEIGLPVTQLICYRSDAPNQAVLPWNISTWLSGVLIALAGLLCTGIGATLLYWARKPIALPHIQSEMTHDKAL